MEPKQPNTEKTPAHTAQGQEIRRMWFRTFMYMNLPIYGWLYLSRLAAGKIGNGQMQDFAKAYLHYRRVILAVALVILLILIVLGAIAADRLLDYMEML